MAMYLMVYSDSNVLSPDNIRDYLGFMPEMIGKNPPDGGMLLRSEARTYNDGGPQHGMLIEITPKTTDPEGVLNNDLFWIIWIGLRHTSPYAMGNLAAQAALWMNDIGGTAGEAYKANSGMAIPIHGGRLNLIADRFTELFGELDK